MPEKNGIAIFSAQFYPHMGGVERYTYKMACELVRRGYSVVIVTSSENGNTYVEKFGEGIITVRIASWQMMNGRMPVLRPSREINRVVEKAFDEGRVQFCVVNTRFYLLSVFGMKFAFKHNIPFITVEHGSDYLTFNNVALDFAERCYEKIITAVGKRYCHDYYAVSRFSAEWLREFGITGKGVLYNSIDPDDYPEMPLPQDIENRIKPIEKTIKIAFAGRLIEEKGIVQLIGAFTSLRKSNENISLIIMGEGPLETIIRTNNDPNIVFLGKQQNKDVINVLRKCDIFCLPSRSEGFSSSILEAAIAKCCIITTRKGGSVELISDDRLGVIIKDSSEDNIASALNMVLDDAEYAKYAGENVYLKVLSEFTWKQCVDQLLNVMGNKKTRD